MKNQTSDVADEWEFLISKKLTKFDSPHLFRSSGYFRFCSCTILDTFLLKRSIFAKLTKESLVIKNMYIHWMIVLKKDFILVSFSFLLFKNSNLEIPGHEMRKYHNLHFLNSKI